MPKRTLDAKAASLRVALVTLDGHLAAAADRAFASLARQAPGLSCSMHCAGEWDEEPGQLETAIEAIGSADIVIVCMLFLEDQIKAIMPALEARRDDCDAMLCFMSAGEVMKLTRIGSFTMDGTQSGPLSLLKKLRGSKPKQTGSSGARQLAMLKRLPRILRFIPGTAQDLRAYFLAMQYWLSGSEHNVRNLIALAVSRYASGPREPYRNLVKVEAPRDYPEVGLYHPDLKAGTTEALDELPGEAGRDTRGTVGVLLMRSYVLAGNTDHYDAVIRALEERGLRVIPAFAGGLDARPAVEKYFLSPDGPRIDSLVSLTGFSLIGGPAYNDSSAAEDMMAELDVPCIAAHGTEFQSIGAWSESDQGLQPIETTMFVALPELDGAIAPTLFAGRADGEGDNNRRTMMPDEERVEALSARVAQIVQLRHRPRAERKVAVVLFNFPPNSGSVGTAAYLSVFRSLLNTMRQLRASGYDVDVPASEDALRDEILKGNAEQFGTDANVHHRIPVDDHVRRETWLDELESAWGPAPGKQLSDGASLFILGRQFGNLFVGLQPSFGYEGDPMRLLFEKNLAPTHAFSAFYRYIREDFGADALLHFGTHGALEFMPGKQSGLSGNCWPERIMGTTPNFYLYAANNPSEGTIAKRRSAATLISYLTPPVTEAGLYQGLLGLKESIDRWRSVDPAMEKERHELAALIRHQADELELGMEVSDDSGNEDTRVAAIAAALEEVRTSLIPNGLHVIGEASNDDDRRAWIDAIAHTAGVEHVDDKLYAMIEDGCDACRDKASRQIDGELFDRLATISREIAKDNETPAIIHALDGGYIRPVAGGDLLRSTEILPTGRNMHSFDPFRIPSTYALMAGSVQADELVARYEEDSGRLPESVAIVLWGTDNIKTEGGPIAQALRLIGARPRFDAYGRLAGAELISLEELGRPRIDAVMTLSGIFRDLLPNQTKLLAEAAWLAASAENESIEHNFVRKHVLQYQADCDCDFETAALRVFSNANGAYGSNVNFLVDSGNWDDDENLAEQYSRRKCYAYGRSGSPERQSDLLQRSLKDVDFTFQNLESAEVGVTTIDNYFDTLGGISRAVQRAKGESVEVYIGDQTGDRNAIRTLSEQVALETRTRVLNPKWYESMLEHGYEGVRQIETHVTNTMGWSATTGKVAPWVYQQISDTFVLDDDMRNRLASLNPAASAKVANRLLEAHERQYWTPSAETLEALEKAGEELEDVLEGVSEVAAA